MGQDPLDDWAGGGLTEAATVPPVVFQVNLQNLTVRPDDGILRRGLCRSYSIWSHQGVCVSTRTWTG